MLISRRARAFYSDPDFNAGLPMPVDGGFLA